jgi:hypothetical protein
MISTLTTAFQKLKTALLVCALSIVVPQVAEAGNAVGAFQNPLGGQNDLIQFIRKIVDLLIQIGAVVVVIYFVYAGFKFVTANGNDKKIGEAKQAAFWCIVGGLILLGAQLIINVMVSTVNQLK